MSQTFIGLGPTVNLQKVINAFFHRLQEPGEEESDGDLDRDHGDGEHGDLVLGHLPFDELEAGHALGGCEPEAHGEEEQDHDGHQRVPDNPPKHLVGVHKAELRLRGDLLPVRPDAAGSC